MNSYWLTFKDHKHGCVEAENETAAKEIGKQVTGSEVTNVKSLPYPAEPRLNKYEDPKYGVCPSFCFDPTKCCGRTACPQRYSCVE